MYGIYAYIWLKFMVNVGKYTIHGSYGLYDLTEQQNLSFNISNQFLPLSPTKKIKSEDLMPAECLYLDVQKSNISDFFAKLHTKQQKNN